MGEIKKMSTVEEMSQVDSLVVSSRELAELMDVEHKNLIRKIEVHMEHLKDDNLKSNEYFLERSYSDSLNRNMKHYDVTRKGCDLLAHKMQGKKGTLFSVAYIDTFYSMERELKIREIDDFKRLAEQAITKMRNQINDCNGEIERRNKELKERDEKIEKLELTIGLRDIEIAINTDGVKQLEMPIPKANVKTTKTKAKAKPKTKKVNKPKLEERFKAIDYKLPPHDNYMSSDKHLPDDTFNLNLSVISKRNNLKFNAKDLNMMLESANLEVLIDKGKRDVGDCIDGLGYARIVFCGFDKTKNKELYDLRWSMAGEKYLLRFISANAFQLDNIK